LAPHFSQLQRGEIEDLNAVITGVGDIQCATRSNQNGTGRFELPGLRSFATETAQTGDYSIARAPTQYLMSTGVWYVDVALGIDADTRRSCKSDVKWNSGSCFVEDLESPRAHG
jgi:hypothetical protein